MNEDGSKEHFVSLIMKDFKKCKKEIDYLIKFCKEAEETVKESQEQYQNELRERQVLEGELKEATDLK